MRSTRRNRALLSSATVLVLLLATTAVALAQQAPEPGELSVEPVLTERVVPTFTFEGSLENLNGTAVCDVPAYELFIGEGVPAPDGTYEVIGDERNWAAGTLRITDDLPGGRYALLVSCEDEDNDETFLGFLDFGRLLITKVVEGPAPTDASFAVTATCTEGEAETEVVEERIFDAAGGVAPVVLYEEPTCEVTEAPGDFETTISDIGDPSGGPGDLTVTVTNTFEEVEEPEEPTEPEEPADDAEVDDTVEEAEPAEPVVQEPDYTG